MNCILQQSNVIDRDKKRKYVTFVLINQLFLQINEHLLNTLK